MFNSIFIKLIGFYKKHVSSGLNTRCKYTPTCSSYAVDALKKHNFFYAFFLIIYRLLRCNPLSKGGIDRVPDKKSDIKWLV
ncbi:MAG: membrane protein insertion efficiency factor YidD [Clostridia bacterium]|nr:membrane protein insertion efficiency factor YidD [Clostridia bacterium]